MHISVRRKWFSDQTTIGEMWIDGVFQCFTLEDCVRPGGKIAGHTAVPDGTYSVIVNRSERFGIYMPLLLDVPHFTGVRIHSGNTAADTIGCVLVGIERGIDCVLFSRAAYANFFLRLAYAALVTDDRGIPIFRLRETTKITLVNEPESDVRSERGILNPQLA